MQADADARWQEAERFSAAGQDARADPIYRSLLGVREHAPWAHLRLAVAALRAGDAQASEAHALGAFGGAWADPELLELVAKLLLRTGCVREALACAEALLRLDAPTSALAEVGKMLSDHMLPEAALPLLQRAMAKGLSRAPMVQYLVGLNLLYAGRHAEALEALEASLRGNPDLAPAHWALAKLADAPTRGARIDRLRAALVRIPPDAQDAPLLGYALFHELDRAGDTAAAWPLLEQAMRRRRAQVRYDESAQDALFDAAARALELPEASADAPLHDGGAQPLFVVGMPRTGTTVIEQHLCARTDAASAGELRDLALQLRRVTGRAGPPHFDAQQLAIDAGQARELGVRYLERSRWRAQGHALYLDKWPENYLAIGLILAALPAARVVWVRRDPMDACFSNLKEWFAASYFYSYDMGEVARHCARFERLHALARSRAGARVACIGYEDFARAPEATIERAIDALGIPRRAAAPSAPQGTIATASAAQAREAVSTRHIGAWRRYAQPLAPLRAELERLGLAAGEGGA